MVCFHDDTQMIIIHGNRAWEADKKLASNAKNSTPTLAYQTAITVHMQDSERLPTEGAGIC